MLNLSLVHRVCVSQDKRGKERTVVNKENVAVDITGPLFTVSLAPGLTLGSEPGFGFSSMNGISLGSLG